MTLVGKIFVVLILVFSLVFMTMAVAVYQTHTNWRDVVENPATGLRPRLQAERTKNQNLVQEKANLEKELQAELERRNRSIAALQAQAETLRDEYETQVRTNADLRQQAEQAAAAMLATQKTLEALRDEVGGLRDEIRTTEADKETQFQELIVVKDQLFQAEGEQQRLEAKSMQLLEQISKLKLVLDRKGIDENEPVDGIPPKVDGIVLAINDQGMVEISLGSDDGLRKGHQLEVYRSNKYLGRIEIVRATPDKAVAKIVPQFRQGNIQKEDRVATRLN